MERVLLLEDSDSIRESVENYLLLNDYEVTSCVCCADAVEALEHCMPDLALVDVSLPDGNGFFFARENLAPRGIPFLFLTSQNEESDRITGLELGALDYITKPFSLKELILRIKAILKRSNPEGNSRDSLAHWSLSSEILSYNKETHRISVDGKDLHLTTMEWEILSSLINHDGALLSREQIQKQLQFMNGDISPRTIDSHIKNIRRKLGNPQWIIAVRGFGFRFAGEKIIA